MVHRLDHEISFYYLLRFSLPTILSTLFFNLYITIDGVFVSRLISTNALSAVNIIYPILALMTGFGAMVGVGTNAYVARLLGKDMRDQARSVFSMMSRFVLIISLSTSLFLWVSKTQICEYLTRGDALALFCEDYFRPFIICFPVIAFGWMLEMFFITVGKAHYGLILWIIGGISNIVLDYLFIQVFDWQLVGASWASCISYLIPSILSLLFFSRNTVYDLKFSKTKFQFAPFCICLKNGFSELITVLLNSFNAGLLNRLALKYGGSDQVAALSILIYLQYFFLSLYRGYSVGISPIISFNLGQDQSEKLKSIWKKSLHMILISATVVLFISLSMKELLIGIFVMKFDRVFSVAAFGYPFFAASFVFAGFNLFFIQWFTGLNQGGKSALITFCRTGLFLLIPLILFPFILGGTGLWLCYLFTESMTFLLIGLLIKKKILPCYPF